MSVTHWTKPQSNRWPENDEALSTAFSIGTDYAGIVSWEDIEMIVAHGRHFFVSAVRISQPGEDARYEVILRGESGAARSK